MRWLRRELASLETKPEVFLDRSGGGPASAVGADRAGRRSVADELHTRIDDGCCPV